MKMNLCPFLPEIDRVWLAAELRGYVRGCADAAHYRAALCCAQSRWQDHRPAQALLMLNRAFALALPPDTPVIREFPWPYAALVWILKNSASLEKDAAYLGNPRRHFQHLATRMQNGPLQELRVARAWACWWLTCHVRKEFPADTEQLEREGIREPDAQSIYAGLERLAGPAEAELWWSCGPC